MHRYATQVSQDNKHRAKEKKQQNETACSVCIILYIIRTYTPHRTLGVLL